MFLMPLLRSPCIGNLNNGPLDVSSTVMLPADSIQALRGFFEGYDGFGQPFLLLGKVTPQADREAITLDLQLVLRAFEFSAASKRCRSDSTSDSSRPSIRIPTLDYGSQYATEASMKM